MTKDDFLDQDALVALTGRRQKSKQIEQLRRMGVRFYVNAAGHPVVAESAINGKPAAAKKVTPEWSPKWAGNPA